MGSSVGAKTMIDPKLLPTVLKSLLAHGDAEHQRWLCEAIDAVFDGRHPPAPYGKANWEVERDALRAERELLVAVAEAAEVFEYFLSKSKRSPGRLQRTLTAWRER